MGCSGTHKSQINHFLANKKERQMRREEIRYKPEIGHERHGSVVYS